MYLNVTSLKFAIIYVSDYEFTVLNNRSYWEHPYWTTPRNKRI